ncbi:Nedd4-binding protein 1-like protein [Triplophysa rosa]|uniref:Nedd4-binding protein 1-like protein n=1 Tax=Triplophysa rosa TaxID=992332 RepID=A0A9W7X5P7_TRIRA|nr:Nedd4-binding protein 1-like protein [Triplophysa rosa]
MALSALTAEGLRRQWMDGETEEPPLEDEFTCAGVLRGALGSLRPTLQQVFGVTLSIGGEDAFSQDGQMWLRLCGAGRDVQAAKVFVKGVVNQEAQQEFQFPEALYCVFCGARGLFMDCLIKNTSAHLVVGSPSCLLITGLEEPVVKAYSFITDLIEKYKSSQGRCSDLGSVITGESLDLLQRFKSLVEGREDRHTVSLLVLPVTVKKVLLDLVKQSGRDEKPGREDPSRAAPRTDDEVMPHKRPVDQNRTIVTPVNTRCKQSGSHGSVHHGANSTGRTSDVSNGFVPVSLRRTGSESLEETERDDESGHGDEFQHLLKFFTAMGFTEEVVQRVLARTGPKEASQLLDLIQQEQDKSGQRRGNTDTLRKDTDESATEEENAKPDDFVLGVLKKAAATCGYTEEKVEQVYSSLTEPNPRQLLMELQRPDRRPGCDTTVDPRTGVEENAKTWSDDTLQPLVSVRGPPQTTYTSRPGLENLNVREVSPDQRPMNSHLRPAGSHTNHSFPKGQKISGVQRHDTQSKPRASRAPAGASTGVTGRQRFIEGLKTQFRPQLSDDPGDEKLRQIIVDGSNVAMSHGLGVFFSCRGIALAVQHFWGRGHRKITVFVPRWRQKKDSKIKEQHYLTELQDLGLLSFTPSREVEGCRINSYDDRFMLRLAQQTNGVIVTNDNLRDLVDESPAWRDIIKRSLLQYVFAGDLFMLPDDPMGRGGPHLNDFLQTHNSLPPPGSHSFAGVSSSLSSPSPAPRAHTEVLQYRDWTPGGHGRGQGSVGGEGRGHGEEVRTAEDTQKLSQSLMQIFPEQESIVHMILQRHPSIKDINRLTNFILEQQE